MKRFFSSVLVLAVLIIALAVPAYATFDVRTFTYEFVDPYSVLVNDENGLATFSFSPGTQGLATASTDMVVPTGGYGRVYAYIAYHCVRARSSDSTEVKNGVMSCSITLSHPLDEHVTYTITTKTTHYANLIVNGSRSYWEYTYESTAHDPTITVDSTVNPSPQVQ